MQTLGSRFRQLVLSLSWKAPRGPADGRLFFPLRPAGSLSALLVFLKNQLWFGWFSLLLFYYFTYFTYFRSSPGFLPSVCFDFGTLFL